MQEDSEDVNLQLQTYEEKYGVNFSDLYIMNSGGSYSGLTDKPSINSVVLDGALTARDLGLGNIYYDTTYNWNLQRDLVSEQAAIYIYNDYSYKQVSEGNDIPIAGIKIGDGTSYLIDLPFISEQMTTALINHIADTSIHVTQAEKDFWNNKVSAYLDDKDSENLILSKTKYATGGDIYNG